MTHDFSNIKIQQPQISNNDVSEGWINMCKLLSEVDNVDLPEDYLQFIKQFGEGAIGDHIYIFPILKLCERTKFWRDDNPTKAEVQFFKKHNRNDCTVIGKTSDGDVLIYLKGLYYFSTRQYEEKIYVFGSNLESIFNFFQNDSKYGNHDINNFVFLSK